MMDGARGRATTAGKERKADVLRGAALMGGVMVGILAGVTAGSVFSALGLAGGGAPYWIGITASVAVGWLGFMVAQAFVYLSPPHDA